VPLTCSADSTNTSESDYVAVLTGDTQNIHSALAFFGTQNTNFTLVFFAAILVSLVCLIVKHTPIASALNRLPAGARSTKQSKHVSQDQNPRDLMARVAELVTKTSCRANTASVTAAGVLAICTSAARWFTSALVRGPAAVAIVLVLVLYYGDRFCTDFEYEVKPPDVPTNTPNKVPTEVPTDAPTTGISCDGSYLYYYFADQHGGGGLANNHQPAGGDEGNDFEPSSATDAPPDVPTNTPNEVPTEVPTDAPTTGISCGGSYLYYYDANEHGGGGLANNHQPAGKEGNDFEPSSATDAPLDVPTNTPKEVPTAVLTDVRNLLLPVFVAAPLIVSSAAATKFRSRSTFKNALFTIALVSVFCPATAQDDTGRPTAYPTYAPAILIVDPTTKYAKGFGNSLQYLFSPVPGPSPSPDGGCGPLTERLRGVLTEKGEHVCKYYACPLDQYSPSNKFMCSNPYGEEKKQCPLSIEDITKYDTSTLNEYDPGCTACEAGRYRRPNNDGECLSCPKGYTVSHAITRTCATQALIDYRSFLRCSAT
jgi:hypothetical protein